MACDRRPFPAWKLSDDHGRRLRFTGLFLGVRADDLDSTGWTADFEGFDLDVPADDADPEPSFRRDR